MSNDQPRPPQRYSRFSRAETMPPQPSAEPSLEEIASRALNQTRSTKANNQRTESYDRQPPPPPIADFDEAVTEPQKVFAGPRNLAPAPREAAPPQREVVPPQRESAPAQAEAVPVPPEPRPAPPVTRRIAELRPVQRPPAAKPQEPEPAAAIIPELVTGIPEPAAAADGPAEVAPVVEQEVPSPEPIRPAKAKPRKEKREGPGVAQRVLAHARAKALPAFTHAASRSALWVAHNLRRRELRKRFGEALTFTHNRVLDRRLEQLFFVPTLRSARVAPVPDRPILYDGPVPGRVFNWAMAFLPKDLREYAFIDFRAGSGRPMLLAARYGFDRIIGFEFDEQSFDDLQMNVAHYPRSLMTCRNIDCYRGDLDGISIPDQPSVLYFQAAWREDMIPGVMDYVRETYRQSPRPLYVVLENVDDRVALEGDGIFQRLEPVLAERVKLRLLSPMEFQVYRAEG